jgi:hypothetical protein
VHYDRCSVVGDFAWQLAVFDLVDMSATLSHCTFYVSISFSGNGGSGRIKLVVDYLTLVGASRVTFQENFLADRPDGTLSASMSHVVVPSAANRVHVEGGLCRNTTRCSAAFRNITNPADPTIASLDMVAQTIPDELIIEDVVFAGGAPTDRTFTLAPTSGKLRIARALSHGNVTIVGEASGASVTAAVDDLTFNSEDHMLLLGNVSLRGGFLAACHQCHLHVTNVQHATVTAHPALYGVSDAFRNATSADVLLENITVVAGMQDLLSMSSTSTGIVRGVGAQRGAFDNLATSASDLDLTVSNSSGSYSFEQIATGVQRSRVVIANLQGPQYCFSKAFKNALDSSVSVANVTGFTSFSADFASGSTRSTISVENVDGSSGFERAAVRAVNATITVRAARVVRSFTYMAERAENTVIELSDLTRPARAFSSAARDSRNVTMTVRGLTNPSDSSFNNAWRDAVALDLTVEDVSDCQRSFTVIAVNVERSSVTIAGVRVPWKCFGGSFANARSSALTVRGVTGANESFSKSTFDGFAKRSVNSVVSISDIDGAAQAFRGTAQYSTNVTLVVRNVTGARDDSFRGVASRVVNSSVTLSDIRWAVGSFSELGQWVEGSKFSILAVSSVVDAFHNTFTSPKTLQLRIADAVNCSDSFHFALSNAYDTDVRVDVVTACNNSFHRLGTFSSRGALRVSELRGNSHSFSKVGLWGTNLSVSVSDVADDSGGFVEVLASCGSCVGLLEDLVDIRDGFRYVGHKAKNLTLTVQNVSNVWRTFSRLSYGVTIGGSATVVRHLRNITGTSFFQLAAGGRFASVSVSNVRDVSDASFYMPLYISKNATAVFYDIRRVNASFHGDSDYISREVVSAILCDSRDGGINVTSCYAIASSADRDPPFLWVGHDVTLRDMSDIHNFSFARFGRGAVDSTITIDGVANAHGGSFSFLLADIGYTWACGIDDSPVETLRMQIVFSNMGHCFFTGASRLVLRNITDVAGSFDYTALQMSGSAVELHDVRGGTTSFRYLARHANVRPPTAFKIWTIVPPSGGSVLVDRSDLPQHLAVDGRGLAVSLEHLCHLSAGATVTHLMYNATEASLSLPGTPRDEPGCASVVDLRPMVHAEVTLELSKSPVREFYAADMVTRLLPVVSTLSFRPRLTHLSLRANANLTTLPTLNWGVLEYVDLRDNSLTTANVGLMVQTLHLDGNQLAGNPLEMISPTTRNISFSRNAMSSPLDFTILASPRVPSPALLTVTVSDAGSAADENRWAALMYTCEQPMPNVHYADRGGAPKFVASAASFARCQCRSPALDDLLVVCRSRTESASSAPSRSASPSSSVSSTRTASVEHTASAADFSDTVSLAATVSLPRSSSQSLSATASHIQTLSRSHTRGLTASATQSTSMPAVQHACRFTRIAVAPDAVSNDAVHAGGTSIVFTLQDGAGMFALRYGGNVAVPVAVSVLPSSAQTNGFDEFGGGLVKDTGWVVNRTHATLTLAAAAGLITVDTPEVIRIAFAPAMFDCAAPAVTAVDLRLLPEASGAVAAAQQVVAVAGVATALALGGSAGAGADMQAMVAVGFVQCGSSSGRAVPKHIRFLLGPFGGDNPVLVIVFNLLLVAGLASLQLLAALLLVKLKKKTWRDATAVARFPSMAVSAASLQLQGTSLYAFRMLLSGDVHPVAFLGVATSVAVPATVRWLTRYTARPTFCDTPHTLIFYRYCHMLDRFRGPRQNLWAKVLPVGRWGPRETAARFAGPVRQLRPHWIIFSVAPSVQTVAIALVAAMPIEGGTLCAMQFVVLIAIVAFFGATVFLSNPYRVPAFRGTRIASSATLVLSILAALWLARGSLASRDAAVQLASAAAAMQTAAAVLQTVHVISLKVFERVWCSDDGRTHIYLDGVPASSAAVDVDDNMVELLPRSLLQLHTAS